MRFDIGDRVRIRAHKSKPYKGLSYPAGIVTVADSGASGGWDVYDTLDGTSFYGFSVERVYRAKKPRHVAPGSPISPKAGG